MPARVHVSTHFVGPLSRALEARGIDTEAFFATHDLAGEHPRHAPVDTAIAAWCAAAELTGDPAIGVHAARSLGAGDYGVLEYTALSSSSQRAAFECMGRYHSLLNDGAALELIDAESETTIRYLQPGLPPAYIEFVLGAWIVAAENLPDGPLKILAVSLPYPSPADTTAQRALFGEDLRFDAAHPELIVDRSVFERPITHRDQSLNAAFDRYTNELLDEVQRRGRWSSRVAEAIERALPDGTPHIDDVAASLGLTPRTLRRRLDSEGQTFKGLLDATRRRLAFEMLADDSLSLATISFSLGFSEPSAFHRAFRRWTGHTPRSA